MKKLPALLLVLGLLTGCAAQVTQAPVSPQPDTDPDISAAQPQEFSLPYCPNASLHPITGRNQLNILLSSLVYQGLFELDNTFTARPVLCSGASVSEDGLLWTLTLGDHTFSDGSPVTAQDVVSSLELARGEGLYAGRLSGIRRAAAEDDSTVLISLSAPNGLLPALLDIPIIRDNGDGSMPLGTGPYFFVEDDGPLRLARRDGASAAAPAEIPLVAIDAADDLIYAFDCGDISLISADLTGSNALGYSSGYEVFSYPTTCMVYVGFQTGSGACKSAAIRSAISRCFDRGTVAGSIFSGHAAAASLPVSPFSPLYSAGQELSTVYGSEATGLFLQAGCAVGEDGLLYLGRTPLTLTFVVNTDNSFKLAAAEYLAQQLTELGITVELERLTWEDYTKALESGSFDLYLGEVTLTGDFDLTALLTKDGALNYGGFDSPELEALLAALRAAGDGELAQTADALWTQFSADAPFAPLCFKNYAVLTRWGSISGLNPTRQDPFYGFENLRFGAVK